MAIERLPIGLAHGFTPKMPIKKDQGPRKLCL